MVQTHLTYKEATNFGCFYTPNKFVNIIFDLIQNKITQPESYTVLDNSCGYGSFLNNENIMTFKRIIGADIDKTALNIAYSKNPNIEYYLQNALYKVSRSNYNIKDDEKLIIVGNPPYNDVTSKVKIDIKKDFAIEIDDDIKTRDLGISFILSYEKLNPDYVCILHPLSYLIKKPNYNLMAAFLKKYELIDSVIINSQEFALTSKGTGFPIVIALYKKNNIGTSYDQIINSNYKTIDNKIFNVNFDNIKNYIVKYPSKSAEYDGQSPLFWTMRDINALKRSKTFVNTYSDNTIIVDINKLDYYCYVDVFKDYIGHMPYYFGNCEIMIDNEKFQKNKIHFILRSIEKNPFLLKYFNFNTISNLKYDKQILDNYFKELLGDNYVY